ncbi:MAG: hypothetical protein LUF30_02255 [Lachnospiraceae bacterium]|nr:hypothetical protein [Lachnospiraceae bacterium]
MKEQKLRDRIRNKVREETGKLALLSWKERFAYIWDYYKPLMVGIIAVIAVINICITSYRNLQIDTVFYAYLIDCYSYYADTDALTADFTEYIGGIGEKEEILIDTSLVFNSDDSTYSSTTANYQMKYVAVIAANQVDVSLMDQETFEQYAELQYYADLTEVLTEEQLEKWADRLIYIEDEEGVTAAYGIDLSDSSILTENYLYSDTVYGGVIANSEHMELCGTFFEWLLEE